MSQTRLVEVRHGGATTVREFRRYAGLDLLPRLLVRDGELDPAVGRGVLEARLAIGPTVAAMAAVGADAGPGGAHRRRRATSRRHRRRVARQQPRWRSGTRSSTRPTRWCSG